MLTHTHDECKYRFRAFGGVFSGHTKQHACSLEGNFLQYIKLSIFLDTVLFRKVFNSRQVQTLFSEMILKHASTTSES